MFALDPHVLWKRRAAHRLYATTRLADSVRQHVLAQTKGKNNIPAIFGITSHKSPLCNHLPARDLSPDYHRLCESTEIADLSNDVSNELLFF